MTDRDDQAPKSARVFTPTTTTAAIAASAKLWRPPGYKAENAQPSSYWHVILPGGIVHRMLFGSEEAAWGGACMHHALTEEHALPIPMLLTCPYCKGRHIDEGAFAHKPHHTHACQHCGMTWRPAIVATVGVQFLPGFKNDTEDPTS